uniref:agmatine deiminase family protein n=1 Tax=Alloprevotella sp. TaxID=1872471 RepID=UPI004027A684
LPAPRPQASNDVEWVRLPATYANFLIMNTAVLYPTYAQPEKDEATRQALQRAFPKADLVGIDCRPLIRQHGSLHCATMQYPKGVVK